MNIWHDPRADTILRENRELHTAKHIAVLLTAEFGVPVTRNAVVGRSHRLGLATLDSRGMPMAKRTQFPIGHSHQKRPDTFMRNAPPFPVLTDAPPEQRLTLMQLEDDTCRFPIGDPREEDAVFCPRKKIKGSSYCGPHTARCNNPPYR